MNVNFQKFVGDAATAFSRAKQFTEEKLGTAEKTEYDAHFENLLNRLDQYEHGINKVLSTLDAFIQPNPAIRAEDFVANKVEQLKRQRITPAQQLSTALVNLGNNIGDSTSYGKCLIQCGQAQLIIGQRDEAFQEEAISKLSRPLRSYLENEIKTIHKERRSLESKRLDLDACKTRLKKATNEANRMTQEKSIPELENELRIAQSDFNNQVERTKLLLDNLNSAQASHQHCLLEFVKAQADYYEKCHTELQKLLRQFSG